MRYIHFLIIGGILSFSVSGVIYFDRQRDFVLEKSFSANLQANLLGIKAEEAERFARLKKEKITTLLFTGDIMLSRGIAR